jgi:carboxylesterase type B
VGDIYYHAPRLYDSRQYAEQGNDTYVYRFNTRPYAISISETAAIAWEELLSPSKGVAHFCEVAFVFNSLAVGGPEENQALSDQTSAQWITFAHNRNPDDAGLPEWPEHGSGPGGYNLVLQNEGQGGSQIEPDSYRLAGREFLSQWQRRRHV